MSAVRLNRAQKSAVTHKDGALLVLAGAGSGKTGVITRRIEWLVSHQNVSPDSIIAVTFTNKAAREMGERVEALLGKTITKSLSISTFHRFGLTVLRQEAEVFGYNKKFSIVDPTDAAVLVLDSMRGGESTDAVMAERVQWRISKWKNMGLRQAPSDDQTDPVGVTAAVVWPEYEKRLAATNSVDIDDLIVKPSQIFRDYPEVLERWKLRARNLLIDEYQDTNGAQYELVRLLTGDGRGLTVVGDDDQSIYAWRGAQPENLGRLSKDFPDLTVVKLEQNYRSMGRILKAANQVISNNPRLFEKNLFSEAGYGDPIKLMQTASEDEEASTIVSNMMGHRFRKRTKWADYAVLYRSNQQARLIEIKMRQMNVPYRISGGPSFFDRSEIRDIMAYMRLLTNPADDAAFVRVVNRPRRGIGTTTIEALNVFAAKHGISLLEACGHAEMKTTLPRRAAGFLGHFFDWVTDQSARGEDTQPGEFMEQLLDDCGYSDWVLESAKDAEDGRRRKQNVSDLIDWLTRLGDKGRSALSEVVADLVLASALERKEDDAGDEVSLMTLHAAKGLEFDYVTIAGLEEGLLPHRTSIELDDVDEERRLFYVGITRARKELTLTLTSARRRQGRLIDTEPSRFIDELPADDLAWNNDPTAPKSKAAGLGALASMRASLGVDTGDADASD